MKWLIRSSAVHDAHYIKLIYKWWKDLKSDGQSNFLVLKNFWEVKTQQEIKQRNKSNYRQSFLQK